MIASTDRGFQTGCYDADRREDGIRVCRRRKPRRDPGRHAARFISRRSQPDFVIGSSAGAINAGYFAGAPHEEGVEKLANIWSDLRGRDVFPFTFTSALGLLRHPGHFTDSIGLRRLIETNLPYKLLEDAVIPVHVTATDVEGVAVLLSKGPVSWQAPRYRAST